jgi:hypothetical protein
MPNPEGDAGPGTGPRFPVYRANGAGAIRPADGGPVYDIDVSSLDLNAIYGRSNGAGAIRPNEFADPLLSGGTLPVEPGGDPTTMA